jgi:formamidopyrimidine-DNA glycosylase
VPERPELDHQQQLLTRDLVGAPIEAVELLDPVLLRRMVPDDPRVALPGRAVTAVRRRAHFLLFSLSQPAADDPELALFLNPMLAGRLWLGPGAERRTADTGFVLRLRDGRELRYRDRVQMGKIYLLRRADEAQVPGLAQVGVDVLSADFTVEHLQAALKRRRDQIKVALMDKAAFDALGNAYADEALFEAGLHPKARCSELGPEQVERLHAAVQRVLREAAEIVSERDVALDDKPRDFLKVRNRKGQPCPRCGAPVRVAGVLGHDAFYCAVCQPDLAGRVRVPWGR